jgi:DNA-binding transcriptional regulator YiaG
MSKIASVLKEEISRLARKEVNARTGVLRKANTQYRRDIAQLKRQADALARQVQFLERQEKKRVAGGVPATAAEGRRFSRRGLATHRQSVGLSAADYGKLVGVTGQTIYSWEQGKSRPRDQQLAALLAVRDLRKREAQKRLELLEG